MEITQEIIEKSCEAEQHIYDAAAILDSIIGRSGIDPDISQAFYIQIKTLADIGMGINDLRNKLRRK